MLRVVLGIMKNSLKCVFLPIRDNLLGVTLKTKIGCRILLKLFKLSV